MPTAATIISPEPATDGDGFARLLAAVTADWSPRDAYERRWVRELVASLWRQDRLRDLELASLAAAAADGPPSDATMTTLVAFARYGARIDKDIGRALYALRALRNRPDKRIAELRSDTSEPGSPQPQQRNCTNELSPRTREPERPGQAEVKCTIELPACTSKPDRPLNRHQRRVLAPMRRKRAA